MSFSGREPNRFLASDGGRSFVDLSYFSGAASTLDGRVVARGDLDRDGDEELILVSRNQPVLTIYSNELPRRDTIAVRIERPIGARVDVTCGDRTLRRDVSGGEGFGTQNARTLTIGLGDCRVADRVRVQHADGTIDEVTSVPAGSLVDVRGGASVVRPGWFRTLDIETRSLGTYLVLAFLTGLVITGWSWNSWRRARTRARRPSPQRS